MLTSLTYFSSKDLKLLYPTLIMTMVIGGIVPGVMLTYFSSKDLKPLYPTGLFPTAFFLHKNLLVLTLILYLYLYLYLHMSYGVTMTMTKMLRF